MHSFFTSPQSNLDLPGVCIQACHLAVIVLLRKLALSKSDLTAASKQPFLVLRTQVLSTHSQVMPTVSSPMPTNTLTALIDVHHCLSLAIACTIGISVTSHLQQSLLHNCRWYTEIIILYRRMIHPAHAITHIRHRHRDTRGT